MKELKDEFSSLRDLINAIIEHLKERDLGMLNATNQLSQKIQLMANVLQLPQYVDRYYNDGTTQNERGVYREAYGQMFTTYFDGSLVAFHQLKVKLDQMEALFLRSIGEYEEAKKILRDETEEIDKMRGWDKDE